ncbi:hypothetical protein H8Z60_12735 [Mycolicibacterium fortuitum]|nr:hypothetical protein [Mycolicibacterium fortuitum]
MPRTIAGATVAASMLRNHLALCALGATFSLTGCISPDQDSANPAGTPEGAALQSTVTHMLPGR